MKRKNIIIIIGLIIITIVLSFSINFLVSSYKFYTDKDAVDSALVIIKDDLPTKLYYTGLKLSGTLNKEQEEKANFIQVEENHEFIEDSNYVHSFLIFNRIDFSNENHEKYYINLQGLDNIKLNFAFYKCKNIDNFITTFNYQFYSTSFDYGSLINALRLSRDSNGFKVIHGGQNLGPNKYAKNEIIKGIEIAVINI